MTDQNSFLFTAGKAPTHVSNLLHLTITDTPSVPFQQNNSLLNYVHFQQKLYSECQFLKEKEEKTLCLNRRIHVSFIHSLISLKFNYSSKSLCVLCLTWFRLTPSFMCLQCVNSPDIRHPCSLSPLREPFAKRQCGVLLSEVFQACHPVVSHTAATVLS